MRKIEVTWDDLVDLLGETAAATLVSLAIGLPLIVMYFLHKIIF